MQVAAPRRVAPEKHDLMRNVRQLLHEHRYAVGRRKLATESFDLRERRRGELPVVAWVPSALRDRGPTPKYFWYERQQFNRPYVAR